MLPLNCDKHVKAKLETRGVRSAEDALKKSELDIIELIDVSLEKASRALRQIAKGACPKPINAFQLKEASTGSQEQRSTKAREHWNTGARERGSTRAREYESTAAR